MLMYIANSTQRTHEFIYSLPGMKNGERAMISVRLMISPLTQVRIPRDLSTTEVDAIVAQHAKYGFINANEVHGSILEYTALCYSLGKPVQSPQIRYLFEANQGVLVERGKRTRELAAISALDGAEQAMRHDPQTGQALNENMAMVNHAEVEIVEETQAEGRAQIAEGYHVERSGTDPTGRAPTPNTRKGRRGR